MGRLAATLFVLGNVILFAPWPSRENTCYRAAPTLWWGVMTVTAVGWALIFHVFFIVFVVGLGGPVMMVGPSSTVSSNVTNGF